jgi:thiol-disulfide isomerase/thioredoxin
MKKILTYAFIACLSTQFLKAQPLSFKLSGRILGTHLTSIELISLSTHTFKMDTALIIEDSFVIKGSLRNPHIFYLKINNNSNERMSGLFFVDSGEHNLKIAFNDSVFSIDNVSNSPLQDEYLSHFLPFIYVKKYNNLPTPQNIQAIKRLFDDNNTFWDIEMNLILEYLQMHPRSFVGFWIFYGRISLTRPENNDSYLKVLISLDTSIRYTASGKEFLQLLQREHSILVGKTFPQFILKGINNKTAIVNYKGNSFTLIDYWATWCGPCLRATPALKTIYDKYKSKKFNIISISVDYTKDLPKLKKYIDSLQMIWTHYWDENRRISTDYKIFLFPTYFLLNNKGEIIARSNRLKPILEIIEKKLE